MTKKWVCGNEFFLEGDGMAGSSTEDRGERAGENGRTEKGKKGKREKEIVKKKKKKLKKGRLKHFLFNEELQ
jgi:hypothetical protein